MSSARTLNPSRTWRWRRCRRSSPRRLHNAREPDQPMSSTADVLRSLVAVPSIADLLAHPERAADFPADVARTLLAQFAPLQMALLGRAFAPDGAGRGRARLPTVKDAAAQPGHSSE